MTDCAFPSDLLDAIDRKTCITFENCHEPWTISTGLVILWMSAAPVTAQEYSPPSTMEAMIDTDEDLSP
jgi:hypothetical protein